MPRTTPVTPVIAQLDAGPPRNSMVRSLKTAELVARSLRRMIVDGRLQEGDFLPHEAALMGLFGVSRPTLREAVRVLESEQLLEVRRGSRTGARIRVPGPEIVARPAGLLLELSGATVSQVMVARSGIEPLAARLLAEHGSAEGIDELEKTVVEGIPLAFHSGRLAEASASFHRRLVELSGNATLAMIAGVLHEITERHTAVVLRETRSVSKTQYDRLMRSYQQLIYLLRAGDADEAEAHWRRHMDISRDLMVRGLESVKVRDVVG